MTLEYIASQKEKLEKKFQLAKDKALGKHLEADSEFSQFQQDVVAEIQELDKMAEELKAKEDETSTDEAPVEDAPVIE